jgi:[acyl-carrier-protein] S-malonyltransferase
LAQVCFEGPAEKLDSTVISQPALFVCSLAVVEQLRRDSVDLIADCQAAAGLSLGEYTALVFAGVMEFEDALAVVQQRGAAMQDAADAVASGMVSVLGLAADEVGKLCDAARSDGGVLEIANLLCPGNIAVSGDRDSCERVAELAAEFGAMKAIPLAVAGAFHTSIMQPAVERLTAALAAVSLKSPRIPVICNVDAQAHNDPELLRELLIRQVVSPVLWEDSMRRLISDGCTHFHELGPGRVLRGLLRRLDRKIECSSVSC